MSTFTATGSTGGTFVCAGGIYAIARSAIVTGEQSDYVSFRFAISRRELWLRIGSTAGAQDILSDVLYEPGEHLISFIPNDGAYFMEFQLREAGTAILSGFARQASGIMTLPTPWAEADLGGLRSEQSLDAQFWVHPLYQPRVIERRGTNSWSVRVFQPTDGPFEADNTTDTTMTPGGLNGTTTITSSTPAFRTTDAGSLIRLTQVGQYRNETVSAVDGQTDPVRVVGVGDSRTIYYEIAGTFTATVALERSIDGGATWTTVISHTTGAVYSHLDGLDNQVAFYRLRVTAYTSGSLAIAVQFSGGTTDGVARIVTVDADNQVTVDVLRPFSALTATGLWARGSWSDRFGWPSATALHDGRLLMLRGSRRWQSAADDFESFMVGAEDADSISGTLPGPMNIARWAKSTDRLLAGTSGAEGEIGSGALDDIVTPFNSRARMRTQRGSANVDAAVTESGATVFVHRSLKKLMGIIANQGGFGVVDLTRLHKTAHGGGFVELSWQTEPEPRLWVRRADGQCLNILIDEAEQLFGIARYAASGTNAVIESVGCLPAAGEDAVYFAVRREVDGSTVRHLEKLAVERWWNDGTSSEAVRLHAALVYDGAEVSTLDGFAHLEGESVYCWGNGRISGPYTVTGGEITLDYPVTYAVVGLKYIGQYKGPRLFGDTGLAKYGKVERIGMVLFNAVGGAVGWGRALDKITDYLPDQTPSGSYDSPTELVTNDQEFPNVGSWERDARMCLEFSGVAPASVLAINLSGIKNG